MKGHDYYYTVLLAVLTFWWILAIGLIKFTLRPDPILNFVSYAYAAICFFGIVVVCLRLRSPRMRRSVTRIYNIILLPWFPLGTALGIYGLLKVDKTEAERSGLLAP